MDRPILFCYDGSTEAKSALAVAAELGAHPADAVVLTVWMPAAILLARGGSLGTSYVPDEGEIDEQEATVAQQIAEEGAEEARRRGYDASARIAEATESVAKTIAEVADEIDARVIVCGQRGLGPVRSALLGALAFSSRPAAGPDRAVAGALGSASASSGADRARARSSGRRQARDDVRRQARRERAFLTLHSPAPTFEGKTTIAISRRIAKMPAAHQNAVVYPWTVAAAATPGTRPWVSA